MPSEYRTELSKSLQCMKFTQRALGLNPGHKKYHWGRALVLGFPELEASMLHYRAELLSMDKHVQGLNPETKKLTFQMSLTNEAEDYQDATVELENEETDEEMSRKYETLLGIIGSLPRWTVPIMKMKTETENQLKQRCS